jgi:hypothetical protein
MKSTIARDAIAAGIAVLVTVGEARTQTFADEPISQADRGASARDQRLSAARLEGEVIMFKHKYEDNSAGGRISARESMIDAERGVELEFAGLVPEEYVDFRYKDSEISFRFFTYRDKSEELSDTVIATLGFGLKRIESPNKRGQISPERIREISRNIEEALRAWPASSGIMNYPPSYLKKRIPIRHVKFNMAGWEGSAQ